MGLRVKFYKYMFSAIMGTILAPAVRPIQYAALKLVKRFRKKGDQRPIIATADHIMHHIVLTLGFKTFTDAKFRKLAEFGKISIEEHDRIFNEIQVTWICLILFYIDAVKSLVPLSDWHFWQDVAKYIPKDFEDILMGYGADERNAKMMTQLIDMRYKEYEALTHAVQETNDQYGIEFKSLSWEFKRITAYMQAAAIGTTDHIRRGKITEEDPLIKFLTEQLLFVERRISRFIKKL